MASFPANVLPTTCGQIIRIDRIESMSFIREDEDGVVDILRADWIFSVITMTGNKYDVSALEVIEWLKDSEITPKDLVQAIFDKWSRL